jgi:hypothetical protein
MFSAKIPCPKTLGRTAARSAGKSSLADKISGGLGWGCHGDVFQGSNDVFLEYQLH